MEIYLFKIIMNNKILTKFTKIIFKVYSKTVDPSQTSNNASVSSLVKLEVIYNFGKK